MRPFSLDEWLNDKSLKVVDAQNRPVRIVCHDMRNKLQIIYLVDMGRFDLYGRCNSRGFGGFLEDVQVLFFV